ncbi:molecular chaperone DnaJ [Patulibacter defluvii]|uniref:molecular chaperone DnaJ n=1 Tax=Patulibacter defluvii TaxID=3095358 RepID=UPI002A74B463|nr:molecular chaperone DnaJ [Patulibacter sp. DM4]
MSQTVPRDPYEVLGVDRDADDAQIKKAFRRLARTLHPDVNPDDPEAQERFREVAEANEILSDPEKRATYDRYGHDGLRQRGMGPSFEGFGSLSDLFGAVFGQAFGGGGGAHPGPRPGGDVAVETTLDLAQALTGAKVEVEVEVVARCGTCQGRRAAPGSKLVTCSRCGGHGVLDQVSRTPFGDMVRRVTCDVCQGQGQVPEEPCPDCRGRGMTPTTRTLTVDVPAGIADGQRIRLAGRGHQGEPGAPDGDLYVVVGVRPHERFVRDGDDLVTVIPVPAPRAALGHRLTVDALDEPLDVEVPAGTQPGTTITLRGRGMPRIGGGRRGDLHVVVDVVVPRHLDARQKQLLEELADSIQERQLHDDESVVGRLRRLWRNKHA